MAAHLLSLNVGRAEPSTAKNVGVTGIAKRPVESAQLRAPGPKHGGLGSGVEGDFLGDTRHHGGDYQAVYAFAREELDWWADQLGRELPHGMFGENFTTSGLDVDGAILGERWAVGDDVVLEVCGPRVPCATFAARMGEPGWVKRFTDIGRTGAYLSVVTGGTVRPGDEIEVVSRPQHAITVPDTFRAFMGDLAAAERVLAADCLVEVEAAELRERVQRRQAAGTELD
ncbi:MOSC domain-containing protein YiiM [Phycicoccus badiiscoriae]|uniref:MOSC domain-containing protein YiiM n=1 Tax=Pedococcus badiiscoriae TaxID=642776 RepID=A0A852WJ14_9MICO|nr:MOSC domain-containing protein [Pedococcus badiiscoriae]NYG07611.1 MOSC domain-containing protein YiiM [Pedococcus badiiscoriae]